jgi:hypothetical protein
MQQVANSLGIALIGAVVFSVMPKHPAPADYAHGFLVSTLINLGMLAIVSLLIFRIPKGRGKDPVPRDEPAIEARSAIRMGVADQRDGLCPAGKCV